MRAWPRHAHSCALMRTCASAASVPHLGARERHVELLMAAVAQGGDLAIELAHLFRASNTNAVILVRTKETYMHWIGITMW